MNIAVAMYEKGRSFIMASGLLLAYEGHEFVSLHLLCQGLENICKAMLLVYDHDKYWPKLRDPYGHDLEKLLAELSIIYGDDFLSVDAMADVGKLNGFYRKHQLRYGGEADYYDEHDFQRLNHLRAEIVEKLVALNRIFLRQNNIQKG